MNFPNTFLSFFLPWAVRRAAPSSFSHALMIFSHGESKERTLCREDGKEKEIRVLFFFFFLFFWDWCVHAVLLLNWRSQISPTFSHRHWTSISPYCAILKLCSQYLSLLFNSFCTIIMLKGSHRSILPVFFLFSLSLSLWLSFFSCIDFNYFVLPAFVLPSFLTIFFGIYLRISGICR